MVEQLDLAARYVDAEMHAGNLARARPGSTLLRREGESPGRRAGVAGALDLDADAGGIGVDIELLDLDPHLGASGSRLRTTRPERGSEGRTTEVHRLLDLLGTENRHTYGMVAVQTRGDFRLFGGGLVKAGLCCDNQLEVYIGRLRQGGTLE